LLALAEKIILMNNTVLKFNANRDFNFMGASQEYLMVFTQPTDRLI
jgi:hypothetical protein